MIALDQPLVGQEGNTFDIAPRFYDLWQALDQEHNPLRLKQLVTSEMIVEAHQSRSRSELYASQRSTETIIEIVILPWIKTSSPWQDFPSFRRTSEVRSSSNTSHIREWLRALRPYRRHLNSAFITLPYVGDSSSAAAHVEGPERDVIDAVSSTEAPKTSHLAEMIRAVYKQTPLDDDLIEEGQRAVGDACTFADRELPKEAPLVMVSDDGLVMLQWRDESSGALLIFTGDGTANYSIKQSGGLYSSNNVEFSLAGDLPVELRAAIERIASS